MVKCPHTFVAVVNINEYKNLWIILFCANKHENILRCIYFSPKLLLLATFGPRCMSPCSAELEPGVGCFGPFASGWSVCGDGSVVRSAVLHFFSLLCAYLTAEAHPRRPRHTGLASALLVLQALGPRCHSDGTWRWTALFVWRSVKLSTQLQWLAPSVYSLSLLPSLTPSLRLSFPHFIFISVMLYWLWQCTEIDFHSTIWPRQNKVWTITQNLRCQSTVSTCLAIEEVSRNL